MEAVRVESSGKTIVLNWLLDGQTSTSRCPAVFLRDNCVCQGCLHPSTKQRKFEVSLPLSCAFAAASLTDDKSKVRVTWTDGHTADFDVEFLWSHSLEDLTCGPGSMPKPPTQGDKMGIQPWTAAAMKARGGPRSFDFQKFLSDAATLKEALETLLGDGLMVLHGAGSEPGTLRKIETCVGRIRASHYGGEIFDVINQGANPDNQAYTAHWLPLHTDLPFLASPPDIQMLHCLIQSCEGGENIFADGEYVAQAFRTREPGRYRLLMQTLVEFKDDGRQRREKGDGAERGKPFLFQAWHPTIERQNQLDTEAPRHRINFNHGVRGTRIPQSLGSEEMWATEEERLGAFFEALDAFGQMLHSEEAKITLRLEPGSIVVFDNRRVLHGRHGFTTSHGDATQAEDHGLLKSQPARFLQGAYLNFDDVFSKLRVLG